MSELSHQDKGEPIAPEPDAMKSEHLAEGIRPIMACVGTPEDYGEELSQMLSLIKSGHDVDFFADPWKLEKRGIKSAGELTYAISPVDEKPKFTENLCTCTSLIAVGKGKNGKELSLLTHQDSTRFLKIKRQKFINDLKGRLNELKDMCVDGTIDIVLAGGNINHNYAESIEFLNSLVRETFGFSPVVIAGPKDWKNDDGYLDTFNRRFYLIRPDDESRKPVLNNDSFRPSEVGKMMEKWKKEREEDSSGMP